MCEARSSIPSTHGGELRGGRLDTRGAPKGNNASPSELHLQGEGPGGVDTGPDPRATTQPDARGEKEEAGGIHVLVSAVCVA